MSEFVAQIRAELDTSEAEQKLKNLTDSKHKIKLEPEISTDKVDKKLESLTKDSQKIKLDADIDTKKAEQKLKSLKENQKIELDTEINIDSKSTQKGLNETIEQTRKQTKKNPIEIDYKVSKNSASQISQLKDSANSFFSLFTGNRNVVDFGADKIRSAVSDLKDLNTAMVEIDKTSNLTKGALQSLTQNLFDEASKYGALMKDYMNSAGEFAKAGYSNLNEITETAMLTQIAGNVTADMANKYLISTDAAYKYSGSVQELTKVIDGANNIANKYSVELKDIAEAATVSASFAAQAGVSVEQLTAAEGTMAAVTKRSGSEMGRAFRSILLNLQQVSGEFDGEIIDEEQLAKVEKRCHSLGVELEYMKDGIATLRNPMDILKDLSDAFNSIPDDSADKQGLISDIGGKYHANALSSLLGNWNTYEKMLQTYSEGSGSAMREAMKTADSWEGRLNSLSNSLTNFIDGFVNTDLVKGGITGIEGMVSAFDKLNDAQLFIPTMISSIMGLQNLFTGKGITDIGFDKDGKGSLGKLDLEGNLFGIDFTKMGSWKRHFADAEDELEKWNSSCLKGYTSVKKFNSSFKDDNDKFKDYISTVKDGTASLDGYKKHLSASGVEFEQFGNMKSIMTNALTGFLVGSGVELALAGITTFIDQVIYRQDRLSEKAEESKSVYSSTVSELQSINSELETTQARIDELRSKDKLFPDEQAELAQLERQNALLETQLNIKPKIRVMDTR